MKFTLICERTKEESDMDVTPAEVTLYYTLPGYSRMNTKDIQVEYAIAPTAYRYKTLVELVTEFGEKVKLEHTGLAMVVSVLGCTLNALLLGAKCDYFPNRHGEWPQWDATFIKEEES